MLGALFVLLPLAAAQNYGYGSGSGGGSSGSATTAAGASSTGSSSSSIHTVAVGQSGLSFSPSSVAAKPGEQVVFQFYPGDHSVVEGAFGSPCSPSTSGFFSDTISSSGGPASNAFTVNVTSTDPMWFFCGHTGHCQAGMVGAINPPSSGSDTLDAYKSAAANAQAGSLPSSAQGGTVGAAPTTTGAAASTTTSPGAASALAAGRGGAAAGLVAVVLALVY